MQLAITCVTLLTSLTLGMIYITILYRQYLYNSVPSCFILLLRKARVYLGLIEVKYKNRSTQLEIERFSFWDKLSNLEILNEFRCSTNWPKERPKKPKMRPLRNCRHVMACTVVLQVRMQATWSASWSRSPWGDTYHTVHRRTRW